VPAYNLLDPKQIFNQGRIKYHLISAWMEVNFKAGTVELKIEKDQLAESMQIMKIVVIYY
jgi:hypothetical protein